MQKIKTHVSQRVTMSYRPEWLDTWPGGGLGGLSPDDVLAMAKVYFAGPKRHATFVDVLCPAGDFGVENLVVADPGNDTKYAILHFTWQLATKSMFPDVADPQCEIRTRGSAIKRGRTDTDQGCDRPYKVPASHCRRTWKCNEDQQSMANVSPDHVFGPFGTPTAFETHLGAWVFTVKFRTDTTIWNSEFGRAIDRDTRRTATFDATEDLMEASWVVLIDGLRCYPHLMAHISAMLRDYKTLLDDEWTRRRNELWAVVGQMPCFSGFFKDDPTLGPERLLQQLLAF